MYQPHPSSFHAGPAPAPNSFHASPAPYSRSFSTAAPPSAHSFHDYHGGPGGMSSERDQGFHTDRSTHSASTGRDEPWGSLKGLWRIGRDAVVRIEDGRCIRPPPLQFELFWPMLSFLISLHTNLSFKRASMMGSLFENRASPAVQKDPITNMFWFPPHPIHSPQNRPRHLLVWPRVHAEQHRGGHLRHVADHGGDGELEVGIQGVSEVCAQTRERGIFFREHCVSSRFRTVFVYKVLFVCPSNRMGIRSSVCRF